MEKGPEIMAYRFQPRFLLDGHWIPKSKSIFVGDCVCLQESLECEDRPKRTGGPAESALPEEADHSEAGSSGQRRALEKNHATTTWKPG